MVSGSGCTIVRLNQVKFLQEFLKSFPVLSTIDGVWRCANNGNIHFGQGNGEIQGCLAAKLDNDPVRLLFFYYMEDIFAG